MLEIYICVLMNKKRDGDSCIENIVKCFDNEIIAYNYAYNEFIFYLDDVHINFFYEIIFNKDLNNKDKIILINDLIENSCDIPEYIYYYDIIYKECI